MFNFDRQCSNPNDEGHDKIENFVQSWYHPQNAVHIAFTLLLLAREGGPVAYISPKGNNPKCNSI